MSMRDSTRYLRETRLLLNVSVNGRQAGPVRERGDLRFEIIFREAQLWAVLVAVVQRPLMGHHVAKDGDPSANWWKKAVQSAPQFKVFLLSI